MLYLGKKDKSKLIEYVFDFSFVFLDIGIDLRLKWVLVFCVIGLCILSFVI